MDDFPAPWWVAGGWAIDLFTGSTREHDDVDLLVLRDDQHLIRRQLPTWDVQIAHEGRLEPWPAGARMEPPRSGLWARADAGGPWQLQFLLAEHGNERWWYRRDPRVSLPLSEVGLEAEGIPFVCPELVLLYKSRHLRDHDRLDFERAMPKLDHAACERLAGWLPPNHEWRDRLTRYGAAGGT